MYHKKYDFDPIHRTSSEEGKEHFSIKRVNNGFLVINEVYSWDFEKWNVFTSLQDAVDFIALQFDVGVEINNSVNMDRDIQVK